MNKSWWCAVLLISVLAGGRVSASDSTPTPTPAPFVVQVEGTGPPMLLIPGLQSSGAVWTGLLERYRDRYTLHVVTVAGFAGVPPVGEFSIERLRDTLEYIRRAELSKPVVVGHSLGAIAA